MKYTRYDLNMKKRKNERKKMLLSVIGVVIIAVLIGTGIYKFVILPNINSDNLNNKPTSENNSGNENNKGNTDTPTSTEGENNKPESNVSDKTNDSQEYVMIQCGYYSKKENADAVVSQLNDKVVAVSVTENDKYRVIAYIGSEEKATKLDEQLTAEQFSTTKARFSIPISDICNNQIAEIINGYLQILEKLKDKEVKSVKSQEFKDWVNSLKEESDSKNVSLFNELKETVNKLPEELTKENIQTGYGVIYKVLNNFRI